MYIQIILIHFSLSLSLSIHQNRLSSSVSFSVLSVSRPRLHFQLLLWISFPLIPNTKHINYVKYMIIINILRYSLYFLLLPNNIHSHLRICLHMDNGWTKQQERPHSSLLDCPTFESNTIMSFSSSSVGK